MPAGDLQNYLLTRLAAARGLDNLSSTTDPSLYQCVAWVNEGVRETQRRLLPRRADAGKWTPGRLDKLTKVTEKEAINGASGFARFPYAAPTSPSVSIFQAITIDGYVGREVTLGELWDRSSGYAVPQATEPIFAFGNNGTYAGIFYLPTGTTPQVIYYYLKQPAVMEYDTAENFPLDDDLMPLVSSYSLGRMWYASERNPDLGRLFMDFWEAGIAALVGPSAEIIERRAP